jgi:hypothetical protein
MTIRISTNEIYYKTQIFFAKNIVPTLPNDDRAWRKEYSEWLKEQGAIIVTDESETLIRTTLGVAPGYDFFEFENDSAATMFVLRWA